MPEPLVVAILLTRDRPAMVARAVGCFRRQTYTRKVLIIWDTGPKPARIDPPPVGIYHCYPDPERDKTIGALRNRANAAAASDIIVHWDDDDWSHPARIAEQVALLEGSGKDCVGYNEVLFWDTRKPKLAAWVYQNHDPRYMVGASMCYWHRAWEACNFDDAPHEDTRWLRKNARTCHAVSAVPITVDRTKPAETAHIGEPRMICGIHGGNTESYRDVGSPKCRNYRRATEWDAYARKVMAL